VSELAQENPYEPSVQPLTVWSGAQVPAAKSWPERQQYSVEPALPGMPMLHDRVGSLWSGASVLVQEYPVDGEAHPVTVESVEHDVGITTVVPVEQQNAPPAPAVQVPADVGGTAVPVQLYPVSPVAQVTVVSVAHVSVVVVPPAVQQKSVEPALPATPVLQRSDESV